MTQHMSSSSGRIWSASDLARNPHLAQDKAARVKAMFSAIAQSYDVNNRVHSLGRDQAWRRRTVELCEVRPEDDVLDVACGTGDLTEAFAAARPRSVTGLDFAAAMLDVAKAKSSIRRRRSGAVRPQYAQGDAMDLPFADGSFDIVSIAFGIRNVTDPGKALSEFRRVLRPGGRLIVLEFDQPSNPLLRRLNDIYCSRIMPVTATLISRDRSGAYRYLPRSITSFLTGEELRELITSSGFAKVTSHPMTFGICVGHLARLDREADRSAGSSPSSRGGDADSERKRRPDGQLARIIHAAGGCVARSRFSRDVTIIVARPDDTSAARTARQADCGERSGETKAYSLDTSRLERAIMQSIVPLSRRFAFMNHIRTTPRANRPFGCDRPCADSTSLGVPVATRGSRAGRSESCPTGPHRFLPPAHPPG